MQSHAVDVLRRHARHCREDAPSDPGTYFERDIASQMDNEATECDRAADLLEALSNPPETVEELRERAAKLMRCDDEIVDDVYGPIHIKIPESMDEIRVDVRDTGKAIRAAWFAIVGMTEANK